MLPSIPGVWIHSSDLWETHTTGDSNQAGNLRISGSDSIPFTQQKIWTLQSLIKKTQKAGVAKQFMDVKASVYLCNISKEMGLMNFV